MARAEDSGDDGDGDFRKKMWCSVSRVERGPHVIAAIAANIHSTHSPKAQGFIACRPVSPVLKRLQMACSSQISSLKGLVIKRFSSSFYYAQVIVIPSCLSLKRGMQLEKG